MKSNCWNRFDYVFLLTCVGYKYRLPYIEKELERVGIEKWIPIYDFDSPIKEKIRKGITTSNFLLKNGPLSCLLNHYKAMKTALGLGAKNCLIIEDDTAFLKDVKLLGKIVEELPESYDIAQFSHVKPMPMSDEEYYSSLIPLDNIKYWKSFLRLRDNGCYAISRRAMSSFVEAIEKGLKGEDRLIANDRYVDRFQDLIKVACFPNAAVQNLFPSRNSSDHTYWDRLKTLDNVNLDDYNLSLTSARVFVFTNVFRYANEEAFDNDFRMLELTPRDTVVFLNKAIPLCHLRNWENLGGANVITIHRIHTFKDGTIEWFGEKEVKELLEEHSIKARIYHLDNEGVLYTEEDESFTKLSFGRNYPSDKYPTTGFLSLRFAGDFLKGDIIPVNFYGEDDNSTGKYFMHAWEYEDKYIKNLPNRIFLQNQEQPIVKVTPSGYRIGKGHTNSPVPKVYYGRQIKSGPNPKKSYNNW